MDTHVKLFSGRVLEAEGTLMPSSRAWLRDAVNEVGCSKQVFVLNLFDPWNTCISFNFNSWQQGQQWWCWWSCSGLGDVMPHSGYLGRRFQRIHDYLHSEPPGRFSFKWHLPVGSSKQSRPRKDWLTLFIIRFLLKDQHPISHLFNLKTKKWPFI